MVGRWKIFSVRCHLLMSLWSISLYVCHPLVVKKSDLMKRGLPLVAVVQLQVLAHTSSAVLGHYQWYNFPASAGASSSRHPVINAYAHTLCACRCHHKKKVTFFQDGVFSSTQPTSLILSSCAMAQAATRFTQAKGAMLNGLGE